MISVTFYKNDGGFSGYEFSGHSDHAEEGFDIVCAAVSSAAFLTANNIIDVFREKADVTVEDGYMKLTVKQAERAPELIEGLYRHMLQLSEQYENDIKLKISEV